PPPRRESTSTPATATLRPPAFVRDGRQAAAAPAGEPRPMPPAHATTQQPAAHHPAAPPMRCRYPIPDPRKSSREYGAALPQRSSHRRRPAPPRIAAAAAARPTTDRKRLRQCPPNKEVPHPRREPHAH